MKGHVIVSFVLFLLQDVQGNFRSTTNSFLTRKNSIKKDRWLLTKGGTSVSPTKNIPTKLPISEPSPVSLSEITGSSKKIDSEVPVFDYASSSHQSLISKLDITQTTLEQGLSNSEVTKRQSQFGQNLLQTPPGKSLFRCILDQFDDRLVQILLFVAGLSGIFSYYEHYIDIDVTSQNQNMHWIKSFMEPIIILTILILNATVGVWQERSAEGSLDALKKMQPSLAAVKRDGVWVDDVDAKDLVPGDIIRLRVGDKVC